MTGVSLFAPSPALAFHSFIIPAGEGCALDVMLEAEHLLQFLPRGPGPSGEVEWPGAMLVFYGTVEFILDLETNRFPAFSLEGHYVDVCAELTD